MFNQALLEAIPNVSLYFDDALIKQFQGEISETKDLALIHIDPNKDAHRTVLTFAGSPEGIRQGILKLFAFCMQYVDMREHTGAHPRIGMVDVCPIVALQNIAIEEAVNFTNQLAEEVAKSYNIPIFLYEYNQEKSYRKYLPQIRKGGYEGLVEKMKKEKWKADFGPHIDKEENIQQVQQYGATVMGVRDILIAYNVSLDTNEIEKVRKISNQIRSIGDARGNRGAFEKLRAIAWDMPGFGHSQISMNFLNYKITNPVEVYQEIKKLTAKENIKIIGSELVGLIPKEVLIIAGQVKDKNLLEEKELITAGADYLKLNSVKKFIPDLHILEYNIEKQLNYKLEL